MGTGKKWMEPFDIDSTDVGDVARRQAARAVVWTLMGIVVEYVYASPWKTPNGRIKVHQEDLARAIEADPDGKGWVKDADVLGKIEKVAAALLERGRRMSGSVRVTGDEVRAMVKEEKAPESSAA
ncbi:MAG TPA: hypothetical protein VFX78_03640 [Candidatus Eisenbacteria bacterium]|jgi:hypothetical protein|nr:hypothetical protein [Candidatus Eisenbacteria bacterium]